MSIMPEGVKVYFEEALRKKLWIENTVRKIFENNGYKYIELPTYEYFDDIKNSFSKSIQNKMFKFQDRDSGAVLSLRPDMTSILSKLITLKVEDIFFPEKIYYIGDVFRYTKIKTGVYREMSQAGMELIGGDTKKADLETMILAIETMKKLGIEKPVIEIGFVEVFNSILNKAVFDKSRLDEVKNCILKKDIPTLERIVRENGCSEMILKLPMMIGKKEILNNLRESGVEYLRDLLDAFEDLGYGDNYILDIGLSTEIEYYTGIIINGFDSEKGGYIISGGRYDNLMEINAVGFVVNVDAVVEKVRILEEKKVSGYYLFGDDLKELMKKRREIKDRGLKVEISVSDLSLEENKKYATKKGYEFLFDIDNNVEYRLDGVDTSGK